MNKQEFLSKLLKRLKRLPREEVAERIGFYGEMIDDRMEEGVSEEDAVAEIGSVEEIAEQILEEAAEAKKSGTKRKRQAQEKRKMCAWEIVLLVLGSPLWLALLIAAFAVVLSVTVLILAVWISLWAAELSLAVGALAGLLAFVPALCFGEIPVGLALLSASLVCAGVALFWGLGCQYATKGLIRLTRAVVRGFFGCLGRRRKKNEE